MSECEVTAEATELDGFLSQKDVLTAESEMSPITPMDGPAYLLQPL